MAAIRLLQERDLDEAATIMRHAFGTFLGAPDLDNFWTDFDYVHGRFAAGHAKSFAADADGALAGSNFATRWGSFGFFGPLSIRPALWDRGLAQPLVAAVCGAFEEWGLSHTGLFTFAQSTKHVHLYGKFGFHPRFLTAIMARPAAADARFGAAARHSALSADDRAAAEAATAALTDAIYPGLDLSAEIATVARLGLGDTVLLYDGSRLVGLAVCHYGPTSEAGGGMCFVKFGAVEGGAGAETRLVALLDSCAALAVAVGMKAVLAGVNLAREEAYRAMKALGFRTEFQGVALHRDNHPGFGRPGVFVLDDWR
jgi:GNAT superfamily N-acetyltransferase